MQYNGKHKNQIFWALATSLELAQQHEQHKNVVFLVMMVTKKLEDVHKKLLLAKKQRFWAQKGPLWAIGANYLRIWRTFDPIE